MTQGKLHRLAALKFARKKKKERSVKCRERRIRNGLNIVWQLLRETSTV